MMADVLIIGAGPAGLTAAIYALRAGMKVTVCESGSYGGQSALTNNIENYPGFAKISGWDLSTKLYEQASNLGAKFIFSEVTAVNLMSEEKCAALANGEEICSSCVIIANGLKRRKLGCKGETEFEGKGVSYCATCDGAFFKGKNTAIVGGGNTALEDAIYLSNICESVFLIVRRDAFKGEQHLIDTVKSRSNIEILFNSTIKEVRGGSSVESIIVEDKLGSESALNISGLFIAIGYEPNNKIYNNQIKMDNSGYFIADETCATNIPGVYVAGDCRIKPLRQIITAASDGAVAGSRAAAFVLNKKSVQKAYMRRKQHLPISL